MNQRCNQRVPDRGHYYYCPGHLHSLYTRQAASPGDPKMKWVKVGDLCPECGRFTMDPSYHGRQRQPLTFTELRPTPKVEATQA
jgi:hypothetical protein